MEPSNDEAQLSEGVVDDDGVNGSTIAKRYPLSSAAKIMPTLGPTTLHFYRPLPIMVATWLAAPCRCWG